MPIVVETKINKKTLRICSEWIYLQLFYTAFGGTGHQRGISSSGRALAWHVRGDRFDPGILHFTGQVHNVFLVQFFIFPKSASFFLNSLISTDMEYRQLGNSGLRVPVLSFGTATFGGAGDFFKTWGNTQVDEATRLVNLCLDSGLHLFDTANVYSRGISEEILGRAIKGFRNRILISTKVTFPMTDEINDFGSSRFNLIKSCEE